MPDGAHPKFVRPARAKRAEGHEIVRLIHQARLLLKFLLQRIAINAAIVPLEMSAAPAEFDFQQLRQNRGSQHLRVCVSFHGAGGWMLVFEKRNVAEPTILLEIEDPVAEELE